MRSWNEICRAITAFSNPWTSEAFQVIVAIAVLIVPICCFEGVAYSLEFSASNPSFREAGVQNAVYQALVDEWGSPLRRFGAYDNAPFVMESEIVDAVWDLGAAATAYRNLGGNEPAPQVAKGRVTTDFIGNATVSSFGKIVGRGTIDVRTSIDKIEDGTLPARNVFRNDQGLLPLNPSKTYYREYVLPTPRGVGVGPQRIIRGNGGEYFYTPDHYHSFVPLN